MLGAEALGLEVSGEAETLRMRVFRQGGSFAGGVCSCVCLRGGSGDGGERSDARERLGEVGLPGPAGGQVNR